MVKLFCQSQSIRFLAFFFVGVDELNNKNASLEEALKDEPRIDYYSKHLLNVNRAIKYVSLLLPTKVVQRNELIDSSRLWIFNTLLLQGRSRRERIFCMVIVG